MEATGKELKEPLGGILPPPCHVPGSNWERIESTRTFNTAVNQGLNLLRSNWERIESGASVRPLCSPLDKMKKQLGKN